jgi:hypothetical protein
MDMLTSLSAFGPGSATFERTAFDAIALDNTGEPLPPKRHRK